ncbi:TPA: Dna2/Cas4 domain-containing protein, partial [Candidatus Micrarchaeota archaeon]|nr:Dna2/Cas4 domain-containing protein [Candidatus Micrarchaeota archaeon]
MRIGGKHIQYAVACERELWFYTHGINVSTEDDNIAIGKQIDNEYYRRLRKQVMIDG